MARSRRIPGQNYDQWYVVLDTTQGHMMIPRSTPNGAIEVANRYEKQPRPAFGAPWLAVGCVVLGPYGEEVHRWGRDFDPDGPPRWPALWQGEDEATCRECERHIARGRYRLDGRCLRCAYAADEEQRPLKIEEAEWESAKYEAKQAREAEKAKVYKEPERFRYNPRRVLR